MNLKLDAMVVLLVEEEKRMRHEDGNLCSPYICMPFEFHVCMSIVRISGLCWDDRESSGTVSHFGEEWQRNKLVMSCL